jgi:hypothetical protein
MNNYQEGMKMDSTPKKIYTGMLLGIIGGTLAIFGMVLSFTPDTNSLINMGLCMLCAVAFYGTAGGFRSGGPWNWNMLVAMPFISIAIAIVTTVAGAMNLWIGAALVLIGIVMVLCAACPQSKHWVEMDRA